MTNQVLSLFCIVVLLSSILSYFPNAIPEAQARVADKKEITIASWNIEEFGNNRAGNINNLGNVTEVLTGSMYPSVGANYTMIFVQELRNDGGGFNNNANNNVTLCDLLQNQYVCQKGTEIPLVKPESYGIIYNNVITTVAIHDTHIGTPPSIPSTGNNTSKLGMMKKPPMNATIQIGDGGYNITIYNNHLITQRDPKIQHELTVLQGKINYDSANLLNEKNIMVLGDMNTGTNGGTPYFPGGFAAHPNLFSAASGWNMIFGDTDYTNFGQIQNAYDKIIPNKNMNYSFTGEYGIIGTLSNGVSFQPPYKVDGLLISDHKLIWAKFVYGGVESTDTSSISQTVFMDFDDEPTCDNKGKVFARGEGFVPNKKVDIYITEHPVNNNNGSKFKTSGTSYSLTDVRGNGAYTTKTTNVHGDIANTQLWEEPTPNKSYNIIVDVNQDGKFTNSIDVVDVFNQEGFEVKECKKNMVKAVWARLVSSIEKVRDFVSSHKIKIIGVGLAILAGQYVNVHITDYSSGIFSSTTNSVSLAGITVKNFSAMVNQDGVFETEWSNPKKGQYNIVVDINNDGIYTPGIDMVDYPDEIGFIVVDSRAGHNDIIHLGDNGLEREVYNTGIAKNIYTLAKNLPQNQNVDIYTISERLLKINNPGWSIWENGNNINLTNSAAPVYEFGKRVHTEHTTLNGTLFFSTWKNPVQIFDQQFINYYGKKYNVVIDVNQDGLFDPNIDKVDTYDIGDMTTWFAHNAILDSSANNNPAVSEYKEYLNSKLDLENQLNNNDIYDSETQHTSFEYLCSVKLTDQLFEMIEVESQVGIRVLSSEEYYAGRDKVTGRHVYDQVEFDHLNIQDGHTVVITAHDDDSTMTLNSITQGQNSNLFVCNADNFKTDGFKSGENSKTMITANNVEIGRISPISGSGGGIGIGTGVAIGAGVAVGAAVIGTIICPECAVAALAYVGLESAAVEVAAGAVAFVEELAPLLAEGEEIFASVGESILNIESKFFQFGKWWIGKLV